MPGTKGFERRLLPILVFIWGVAVIAGMLGLVRYQSTPASSVRPVATDWPTTVNIARNHNGATLVMTVHPLCPCSQASLRELEILTSRLSDRMTAYILFDMPDGAPADWHDSELWRQAKVIPNVTALIDPNGRDCDAFGASTSGQVMLFGPDGRLMFSGGITDGRGHEGDNTGMDAIFALMRTGKSGVTSTPVYGCGLTVCKVEDKR